MLFLGFSFYTFFGRFSWLLSLFVTFSVMGFSTDIYSFIEGWDSNTSQNDFAKGSRRLSMTEILCSKEEIALLAALKE